MDEEFGSFVVTDPDIVDEGIDVSGLRTKTDTSLLGNIPELAGVQYEAFNPNRLSDLMRFYQTGLPTRSVSQPTTPPATGGGGSGGGGGLRSGGLRRVRGVRRATGKSTGSRLRGALGPRRRCR